MVLMFNLLTSAVFGWLMWRWPPAREESVSQWDTHTRRGMQSETEKESARRCVFGSRPLTLNRPCRGTLQPRTGRRVTISRRAAHIRGAKVPNKHKSPSNSTSGWRSHSQRQIPRDRQRGNGCKITQMIASKLSSFQKRSFLSGL